LKAPEKKARSGSGSVIQWYGSADPDPPRLKKSRIQNTAVLYPAPVDGKDGRTLVTFDGMSVAGTNMAARTLAARLQNRFLQDHLVHHTVVHRPAYGKMEKMRDLNQNFFFLNDLKSFLFQLCIQQLILSFITDSNLSCSHGVSIYQLQCNLFCSDGVSSS
jgi:hypothetical protein